MNKRLLRWIVSLALLIIVFLVISYCVYDLYKLYRNGFQATSLVDIIPEDDDQRSTLWPLLVSLILTMLGSLITTYIFLKEALDRTLDEKPYYNSVIQDFRMNTMHDLWQYTIFALSLIVVVVLLYGFLYFQYFRSTNNARMIVYVLYVISFVFCGCILHKCIYVEVGIQKTANKLLKQKLEVLSEFSSTFNREKISKIKGELELELDNDVKLACWLQIKSDQDDGYDEQKFINRFSEWERLLMLLVFRENAYEQSVREEIASLVKNGIDLFINKRNGTDFQWEDARENGWNGSTCDKVSRLGGNLMTDTGEPTDRFVKAFDMLSDYRNLLQVRIETDKFADKKNKVQKRIYPIGLMDVFLYFCLMQSVYIFRIFPKIEIFHPSGFFFAANLYGVRFENSSFRASSFKHAIFSRTKINNSNFSISKFEECDFFNADSRNCSFSNTLWEQCSLREAHFEDVDFTGAVLKQCSLKGTSFHSAVLVNLSLSDPEMDNNNITDSKISNVVLVYEKSLPSFKACNFSESSFLDVRIITKRELHITPPIVDDVIVHRLFNYIKNLKIFLFGGGLANEIKRLVNAFRIESKDLFAPKPHYSMSGKVIVPETPIWKYIKELSIVSMEDCVFNDAIMTAFVLLRINATQSMFKNAKMDEVSIVCSYISGSILNEANLRGAQIWASVFSESNLDNAILFKSTCKLVNFEDASLKNLHASECVIKYCSFEQSDCTRIDLTKARVSASSFRDVNMNLAEMTGAELIDVAFDGSLAENMLAYYTSFDNCSWVGTSLTQSNFNHTTFKKCNFLLADFSNSVIVNAKFENCCFKDSTFHNVRFIRPVFKDCTHMDAYSFSRCQFVRPQFTGTSQGFETQLRQYDNIRYVIDEE